MKQRYGLSAGAMLAAAVLFGTGTVTYSSGRVALKETPEERHRREVAQWNADVEAAKRAKKAGTP